MSIDAADNICECGRIIDNPYDRWCLDCEQSERQLQRVPDYDPDMGRDMLKEEGGDDAW